MIARDLPSGFVGFLWIPRFALCCYGLSMVLCAFVGQTAIYAQDSVQNDGSKPPITYRRIYVPADDTSAWPRDKEKYLPVDAQDFETWVTAANQVPSVSPPSVTITKADYSARLDGDQLVDGEGAWEIAMRGDGPAFLPFGELSLVIRDPRWRHDGSAPVRLGAWGPNGGSAEELGLEVSQSAILDFNWRVPSDPNIGSIAIPLRLPSAAVTRFVLDLPLGKTPIWKGSVVLRSDRAPDGLAGWRRWELVAGQAADPVLRIVDDQAAPPFATPTLAIREELNYRITERGLDVEIRLQLSGLVSERRHLAIALPAGVQLVSVLQNSEELSWRLESGNSTTSARALIDLSEEPSGREASIVLRAWQPLLVDNTWTLPKLRPDDVFWTSGSIQLSVSPLLELRALIPSECMQTSSQLADNEGNESETCSLVAYAPGGGIDIVIGRRPDKATVSQGTTLEVGHADVTGRSVTRVELSSGSIHKLSGNLSPGWIVDAVETVPGSALGEWYVDANGENRQLELQLVGAARPDRPAIIKITGRLQTPNVNEPLRTGALQMIRWRDVKVVRNLLLLETIEPYVAEPIGLSTISAATLTDDDRSLISQTAEGHFFNLADAADSAAVRTAVKRGQYAAEIWLDVTLAGDQLQQTHHLVCRPKSGRIEKLLVYASHPLGDDLRWTDASSGAAVAAERVAADDPRRAEFPTSGELWQLRLPRPQSSSIEINATISAAWSRGGPVALISMPESAEQRGRVLLRTEDHSLVNVQAQRMRAISLPDDGNDAARRSVDRVWAAYRYEPAELHRAELQADLTLRPNDDGATASLVIARKLELKSFFSANGEAFHCATYHLENEGAQSLQLSLPENAALIAANVEGQPLDLREAVDSTSQMKMSLPASRFVTASLHFVTRNRPLRQGSTLQPPAPKGSFPLLASEWTIWLPDEFRTLGIDSALLNEGDDWRSRLFGPLARESSARPFGPRQIAKWARFVEGYTDEGTETETAAVRSVSKSALIGDEETTDVGTALMTAPATGVAGLSTVAASQSELVGWRAYRKLYVAGLPAPVVVAHPPAISAWGAAAFLLSLVGGARALHRHRELFIVVTAVAAVLALVLPAAYAPLATGAFLGLLGSLAIPGPRPADSSDAPTRTWNRLTTTGAIAVVLAIALSASATAQPASTPAPSDSSTSSVVQRVLLPVNADGHRVGSKIYVGESFLRQLIPRRVEATSGSGEWVILAAAYRCELSQRTDDPEFVAGVWTMSFDIEVLARDTTLELPLARNAAAWPAAALVDGVPRPLEWNQSGDRCSIQIGEPGRYELAISFTPRVRRVAGNSQIELTIPPHIGATFRLSHPPKAVGLSVLGTIADRPADEDDDVLRGDLDGSGRLVVRWPRRETQDGGEVLRIAELRWLRIGPEGVELTVKYVAPREDRLAQALTISADRRWELINDETTPADTRVEIESLDRQTVQVELPDDDMERREVTLRWRLSNLVSSGQLQLPLIELTGPGSSQCWLAIESDPTLECELTDARNLIAETVDEFLKLWGAEAIGERPQLVVGNVAPHDSLRLAVRPRSIEPTVDEALHVAAGAEVLRVQYQADVAPGSTLRYSFPITVPAELSVDEIAVAQAGQPVPVRVARPSANRVNVFFGEELADSYRLFLNGHVAVSPEGAQALPRVVASDQDLGVERVQVYRDESVLVDMLGPANADDAAPDLPPSGWSARLLDAYQIDKEIADEVRIAVTPNLVKIEGDSLITLSREGELWWATFECQLEVQRGALDRLQLNTPRGWDGPFEVQPAGATAVVTTDPDTQRASLSVRLPEPIEAGAKIAIKIRGPLAPASVVPLRAPKITLEGRSRGRSYITVPRSLNSQPVTWNHEGVRPATPPKSLRPSQSNGVNYESFQIASDSYRVELAPPLSAVRSASVRLADIEVIRGPAGNQLVATRFVLAPQGLTECILELPDDQELLFAKLDGASARIRRLDDHRWTIALGPPQLPQILDVASCAVQRGEPADRRVVLQRPKLIVGSEPIAVEMSLWSFGQHRITGHPQVEGASEVAAVDQAALRLDRLIGIAEAATATAMGLPLPDGYYWFRPWAKQLAAADDAARSVISAFGSDGDISQVSRPSEEQLTRASERIGDWIDSCYEVLEWPELGPPLDPPEASETHRQWPLQNNTTDDWIYYVADGGVDRVTVVLHPADASAHGTGRLVGAIIVVGVTASAIWLARQPAARDALRRWPHAVGVLGGLAWWAYLWPSWLGLAVAAGSLLLLFRPGWPGRSLRMEGSTVLQPGRPV